MSVRVSAGTAASVTGQLPNLTTYCRGRPQPGMPTRPSRRSRCCHRCRHPDRRRRRRGPQTSECGSLGLRADGGLPSGNRQKAGHRLPKGRPASTFLVYVSACSDAIEITAVLTAPSAEASDPWDCLLLHLVLSAEERLLPQPGVRRLHPAQDAGVLLMRKLTTSQRPQQLRQSKKKASASALVSGNE